MCVMAALSSDCRARGQRLRWAALALLLATGCGPGPVESVAGRFVVDVEAWLADPALDGASASARATLAGIAGPMVAATVFEIGDGRCTRAVAGRVERHACRFEREDRGVVVLRATRPDGTTHFVRARPSDSGFGMSLTWEGHTLPVRRADVGAGAAAK